MDLQKIIHQESTTIIDVRAPFETYFGKAKKSINIPLGTIAERIEEFQKMSKPIVLYCQSGNRSGQAMNFLKSQGIKEVYNGGSYKNIKALLKNKVTA